MVHWRTRTCPRCAGTGETPMLDFNIHECPDCKATGKQHKLSSTDKQGNERKWVAGT